MKKHTRLIGVISILLVFGLSACVGNTGEQPAAPQENIQPTDTEAVIPTETNEPSQELTATTEKESSQPEETESEEKPTARVGLQATDPETVKLASGEIQLVEFFAFW